MQGINTEIADKVIKAFIRECKEDKKIYKKLMGMQGMFINTSFYNFCINLLSQMDDNPEFKKQITPDPKIDTIIHYTNTLIFHLLEQQKIECNYERFGQQVFDLVLSVLDMHLDSPEKKVEDALDSSINQFNQILEQLNFLNNA